MVKEYINENFRIKVDPMLLESIRKIQKKLLKLLYQKSFAELNRRGWITKVEVYNKINRVYSFEDLYIYVIEELKNNNKMLNVEQQYKYIFPFIPQYSDIFSSQEGEDILLKRIMKKFYKQRGFYVDIGAYHPIRFSNTFHYYLKGWNGINIDAHPGKKKLFDTLRPRDINIECAVALKEGELDYYQFKEPAFNTFSKNNVELAKERTTLEKVEKVHTRPLVDILNENMPLNTQITFMTIDVEGLEMQVLNSSNWEKYRPYLICIEAIDGENGSEIKVFLEKQKYFQVASTKNSLFYIEKNFYERVK